MRRFLFISLLLQGRPLPFSPELQVLRQQLLQQLHQPLFMDSSILAVSAVPEAPAKKIWMTNGKHNKKSFEHDVNPNLNGTSTLPRSKNNVDRRRKNKSTCGRGKPNNTVTEKIPLPNGRSDAKKAQSPILMINTVTKRK